MTRNGLCIGDEAPDFTLRDQFGQDVRLGDFRRCLGVVLQAKFLFDGRVDVNIKYGRPDATLDEI